MHLGMTGRFSHRPRQRRAGEISRTKRAQRRSTSISSSISVTAPRSATPMRAASAIWISFRPSGLDQHALFKGLGVEPLSPGFTAEWLAQRLKGKATSIKAALLDQRLIAGLGNIYACEALYRAQHLAAEARGLARQQIRQADQADRSAGRGDQGRARATRSRPAARRCATIGAPTASSGDFQHRFKVYGREGKPCSRKGCGGTVRRIVQGGRSTFYCPTCQR